MKRSPFSYLFFRRYELRSKMPKEALLRVVRKADGQWSAKSVRYRVRGDDDEFIIRETGRYPALLGFPRRGDGAEAKIRMREEDGGTVISVHSGLSPLCLAFLWTIHVAFGVYALFCLLDLIITGISAISKAVSTNWESLWSLLAFLLFLFIFHVVYNRTIRQLEEYLEELLIF